MSFNTFWDEDYILLEKEFLNYIKFVPLAVEHYDVWSMKLANLLLLIGSSIDSFFKNALPYSLEVLLSEYNLDNESQNNRIDKLNNYQARLERNNTNIILFKDVFEEIYKLSSKPVYVLSNKEKLEPFIDWETDQPLNWWKVYTNLKHDRIKNRKHCTLGITLNALSALFLLNIYHLESRKSLVMRNKDVIRSNMDLNNFSHFLEERGKINTIQPLIAKTELFGYVYETEGYDYEHPWRILDPANVYGL
jgi:hypothetical protein